MISWILSSQGALVVEILKQSWLVKYALIRVKQPRLQGVALTQEEYNIVTYFLARIIHLLSPWFLPGLSEIGDLSSMVLIGFLIDKLLKLLYISPVNLLFPLCVYMKGRVGPVTEKWDFSNMNAPAR